MTNSSGRWKEFITWWQDVEFDLDFMGEKYVLMKDIDGKIKKIKKGVDKKGRINGKY